MSAPQDQDLVDGLIEAFIDFVEFFDFNPFELAEAAENVDDPAEAIAIILEVVQPADEAAAIAVDLAEEFILAPPQAEGQLTPGNVEGVVDELEGNGFALLFGVIAVNAFVEAGSVGQLEELPDEIFQAVAALGINDVTGREIDARLQEGIDPALKQKVHRDHRSKQADFKDYVEGNLALRSADADFEPRAGLGNDDLPDYFNPADLGWLPDPDTYGTIPAQTELFELDALEVSEPEELIEEPVQYGIPVPKLAIEQVTELRGIPKDAADVYLEVIEQLPKTENLIRDYVRLEEYIFRLREKIQEGTIPPEQAVAQVEPQLRDIIENAIPEGRLREQDRTAEEVVDLLVAELQKNFELLEGLPARPPSPGDIQAWFEKGVIDSRQFLNLHQQFGQLEEAFGFYFEESSIDKGAEDIQRQFFLDRISGSEAELQLTTIGFSEGEAAQILSGRSPDAVFQQRVGEATGTGGVPVDTLPGIGPARSAALAQVGIETVSDMADAAVDTITTVTRLTDEQAVDAIEAAQAFLEVDGQPE